MNARAIALNVVAGTLAVAAITGGRLQAQGRPRATVTGVLEQDGVRVGTAVRLSLQV